MTTIAKNRTRTIAGLKERLTVCTRYDTANYYRGAPTDPEHAWAKLPGKRVTLTANTDASVYTIHVHENLWYELREPEAAAPPDEGAVGDVTFKFPGGSKVTVDPDGVVLDGPDTPSPPEPTDASIRAVLDAVAKATGLTPVGETTTRFIVAAALKRGWLRGWQDAQQATAPRTPAEAAARLGR